MGETAVTVRAATKQDISATADVLARAFEHDPPFLWMLPDPTTRRRRLRILFVSTLRWEVLPRGQAEVACTPDGRIVGATMWLPPGRWRMSAARQLLTLPSSFRAFGRRINYGSTFVTAAARVHPVDPHWYLHGIGVAPDSQGQGIGGALLRSRLDRCDAAGISAYLEASKPANAELYEHFGFTGHGRLALPTGAPEIIPMWRCPARKGTEPPARPARRVRPPAEEILEPPRIAGRSGTPDAE